MDFAVYGLHRGGVDPERLRARARLVEDAGFEGIWVGDHIALPPPGDPRLEVLTTLTFLAAVTERVRLAAAVLVLPQRQPVLLAKQLTSIDVLSGGRLVVGVGVGYVEPELRALGASLADRGAMTDECLAAVLALWSEPAPSFDGRWTSFEGVTQEPRPVQLPRPPIVVGGYSEAAFRRATRFGDGWFGWDVDHDETVTAVRRLGELGRGDLEITVKPKAPVTLDDARRFAEAGVHRIVLHPDDVTGDGVERLVGAAADDLIGRVS